MGQVRARRTFAWIGLSRCTITGSAPRYDATLTIRQTAGKDEQSPILFLPCLLRFFTPQGVHQYKPDGQSISLGTNTPWPRSSACLLFLLPRVSQLGLLWSGLGGKATRKCGFAAYSCVSRIWLFISRERDGQGPRRWSPVARDSL